MKSLIGQRNNKQRIYIGSDGWETHRRVYNHIARESRRNSKSLMDKDPSLKSIKEIEKLICDLENFQPVGLIQIIALCNVIKRKIRIQNSKKNIDITLGKYGMTPIHIELHNGHWTLKNGKNPSFSRLGKNNCLFEAVAHQIECSPREIRRKTIREMRLNEKHFARIIDRIRYISKWKEALDSMSGGAKYDGRSASDAGRVIDDSQNGRCHPNGLKGHPRGHASHPSATGVDDSVENFSRGGWKTGFLSRTGQNLVGNLAFNTGIAQRAMEVLNNGSTTEAVHISVRELGRDDLPMANEFRNGSPSGSPRRFQTVTVVLRHHVGQQSNRYADVFIHTFYPRL